MPTMPHSEAGWRMLPPVSVPMLERDVEGGHGRGRAAGAAAGNAVEVPGVGGRAVGRVLGGRAHGELVHVRLAQDHGARPRGAAR